MLSEGNFCGDWWGEKERGWFRKMYFREEDLNY